MRRTATRVSLAVVTLSTTLGACDAQGCIPTVTSAHTASIVDTKDVKGSSVLAAKVTACRKPVSGLTVKFSVQGHELGSAPTNSKGLAELDLKGAPLELARTATKPEYVASYFSGGGKYCSSADDAPIRLVSA